MNVTLSEREMRMLSQLVEGLGALLVELGAGTPSPPGRPSLALVEGTAKRRTRRRGKLRAVRD